MAFGYSLGSWLALAISRHLHDVGPLASPRGPKVLAVPMHSGYTSTQWTLGSGYLFLSLSLDRSALSSSLEG